MENDFLSKNYMVVRLVFEEKIIEVDPVKSKDRRCHAGVTQRRGGRVARRKFSIGRRFLPRSADTVYTQIFYQRLSISEALVL